MNPVLQAENITKKFPGVIALKDVGFKGAIAVEYESHPKDPMPDMKDCLAVLEKAAKNVG